MNITGEISEYRVKICEYHKRKLTIIKRKNPLISQIKNSRRWGELKETAEEPELRIWKGLYPAP